MKKQWKNGFTSSFYLHPLLVWKENFILLIFVVLIICYFSPSFCWANNSLKNKISSCFEKVFSSPQLKNSYIGAYIIDSNSEEVLYSKNEDKLFVPASNEKLLVAITALKELGKDYTFKTDFYLSDDLIPNLYVKGFGDPTFSSSFYSSPFTPLEPLLSKLQELKLTAINDIIIDSSSFDNNFYPDGWAWDDTIYCYAPPISALSFAENCAEIIIHNGKNGIVFDGFRKINFVSFENRIQSSYKNIEKISISRGKVNNKLIFSGKLGKGKSVTVKVPVDSPDIS